MTPTYGDAVLVADAIGMERADWLDARRQGIGGSDAAVICGLSSYVSPFGLWVDKTRPGGLEDDAGEAAEWGTLLEPIVAQVVEERENVLIDRHPAIVRHPVDPHRIANLDGIATELTARRLIAEEADKGIYEGKTASAWLAGDWAEGEVPDRYKIQGQHYLGVTGLPWCLFGCLIGGQRLVTARMDRDDDLIAHLWTLEDDFWDHVVNGTPPPPDGSKATTELLAHLWDVDPGKVVTIGDDITATLLEQYREQAANVRYHEALKDEAGNQLKLLLGDAEVALDGDGRTSFSWKSVTSKRLDMDALKQAHPEIVAEFTKPSEARRLYVPKKGA